MKLDNNSNEQRTIWDAKIKRLRPVLERFHASKKPLPLANFMADYQPSPQLTDIKAKLQKLQDELQSIGIKLNSPDSSLDFWMLQPCPDLIQEEKLNTQVQACFLASANPEAADHHSNQVHWTTASTNDDATQLISEKITTLREVTSSASCLVCAEHQYGGRGRRGNQWVSPFGRNVYLSVSALTNAKADSPLSLETGALAMQVIKNLGIDGLNIKWPNDLMVGDKKVGGILVEMTPLPQPNTNSTQGRINNELSIATIGIGINLTPTEVELSIDQPWTDLLTLAGFSVDRTNLIANLGYQLSDLLLHWTPERSHKNLEIWNEYHRDHNQRINILRQGSIEMTGYCRGIDSTGALLLEVIGGPKDGQLISVFSGEVSLRQA